MAELYPMTGTTQTTFRIPASRIVPESVPQIAGTGPLWRSLLFPRPGQQAIRFGNSSPGLFASLLLAGVRVEPWDSAVTPAESRFDLVLEDRTDGRSPARPRHVLPFLLPGGRWVVVLENKRCVGFAGHRVLSQARREGFGTIDTFYAYPSLRSPRIMVPLDDPQPFRYFLRLAVGVHGHRQRLLALGARWLCALRLHRMVLSNLIVVARREK
jgi:hypothetical protein